MINDNPILGASAIITEEINHRQLRCAAVFAGTARHPDELSEGGWLCLVAVPWLLEEVQKHRQAHGHRGYADGNPRADCVGLPESPLQFVLSKQTLAQAAAVVPTGNPVAKFLVRFLAKMVGVRFVIHKEFVGLRSLKET